MTNPEYLNLCNHNLDDNHDNYIKNLILNHNGNLIVLGLCENDIGTKVVDVLIDMIVHPSCKNLQYITVIKTSLNANDKERLGKACKKHKIWIAFKKDW